ncbi:MAG: PQQ-binding-like beta-propeller repeat protein [Candidatus Aenigmatarchaeota archaeon]
MDYKKDESNYKLDSVGKTKYYIQEQKEQQQEQQQLPSFRQIFYDVPKSGSIVSFSDFHEGIVYFSSLDTNVYAVSADTGEVIWKFRTGGPVVSTPLVHNDRIYFGSNDEYFYCLDLDGRLIWKKHTGDIIVSSAIGIGDMIFIGNGSGYFFCFSADGKELWKFKTGDGIMAVPCAANGLVFIGSYDKSVYALDMNGNLRWKFTAGERTSASLIMSEGKNAFSNTKRSWNEMPQFKDPTIYCASYDNHLYALDINGTVLWKFNCGTSVPGGIGGENGTVYAGTINGTIFAIDSENGSEKWSFRTGGMVTAGAEIKDRKVYFTSFDQKLYCLGEEGEKLWDFLTGGPILSRPLIAGDKVFFGSFDTLFYCINTRERTVEWTCRTGFDLQATDYAQKMSNIFVEYDRKIFKVWVPETIKGQENALNAAEYTTKLGLDSTFAYGGLGSYVSKGKKKDIYG